MPQVSRLNFTETTMPTLRQSKNYKCQLCWRPALWVTLVALLGTYMETVTNWGKNGRPSILQMVCAAVVLLLFFFVLKIMGAPKQAEINILIQQFHLPKDIKLERVLISRREVSVNPPQIEAYVMLSETEFRTYQEGLNNLDLWRSQPIDYDGQVFIGSYAPDALSWNEKRVGRMMEWGQVSWKQAQDAKRARILCFAMRYPGANSAAIAPYDAAPCSERTRELEAVIIVQGLLDEDNRTLHMLVRGVRPKR